MSQMTEKRPTRIAVAHIYAKRAIRWRRNSYPFISGDAFADLADFVYKPPRWRDFNSTPIENARIIFTRSEDLQPLLSELKNRITASIIITGNSDYEFHEPLRDVPESVRALFLQNSYISDGTKIFSIPLGIEDFRWGVNGNPRFIKDRKGFTPTSPKVLFGPLGKTHETRKLVTRDFSEPSPDWDFFQGRIQPQEFDKLSKGYSHIAAVRGNGVDTHRLWESLYRGITPIVEKSAWWNSLADIFPEVEVIDEWTHANVRRVLATYENSQSFRSNPALWMPYWEKKIENFLN
jgi:hypothetical protein